MLTVWGGRTSSNVQALMWAIGELGLAFRRHDLGHRFGGLDSAEFLALNPNGTIPVLQDGDDPPLWETGAILRHLASRYAGAPFWPEDPLARAHVDRWAEWAKLNVALNFTGPIFWRTAPTAPEDRDAQALSAALARLHEKLAIAEAQLRRHAFLAGPELTLADIQFGHVLHRYYDIEIPRADLPALAAYHARLAARPAFREHVMVSYEELRA